MKVLALIQLYTCADEKRKFRAREEMKRKKCERC